MAGFFAALRQQRQSACSNLCAASARSMKIEFTRRARSRHLTVSLREVRIMSDAHLARASCVSRRTLRPVAGTGVYGGPRCISRFGICAVFHTLGMAAKRDRSVVSDYRFHTLPGRFCDPDHARLARRPKPSGGADIPGGLSVTLTDIKGGSLSALSAKTHSCTK